MERGTPAGGDVVLVVVVVGHDAQTEPRHALKRRLNIRKDSNGIDLIGFRKRALHEESWNKITVH